MGDRCLGVWIIFVICLGAVKMGKSRHQLLKPNPDCCAARYASSTTIWIISELLIE